MTYRPLKMLALLLNLGIFALAAVGAGACGDNIVVTDESPPDAQAPDAPVPERPRLDMSFTGPSLNPIAVGTDDANVLCFRAEASVPMEVRSLRAFIVSDTIGSDVGGLVDTTSTPVRTNFKDVKIWDVTGTSQVVSGPQEVDAAGDDRVQPLRFFDAFGLFVAQPLRLRAHEPRLLCASLDVALNAALVGSTIQLQLGSPQLGDVVVRETDLPLPVQDIYPNTGIAGPPMPIVGSAVPMGAPTITSAPASGALMTGPTVVALRMTVKASGQTAQQYLHTRKMSFLVSGSSHLDVTTPRLRVNGSNVDLTGDSVNSMSGGLLCGVPSSPSNRCISIVLDNLLTLGPSMIMTLEFRIAVYGTPVSGDMLTTTLIRDIDGVQAGLLTGTGVNTIIAGGNEDAMLWSNDAVWFYNGNSVGGTPWSHTLMY